MQPIVKLQSKIKLMDFRRQIGRPVNKKLKSDLYNHRRYKGGSTGDIGKLFEWIEGCGKERYDGEDTEMKEVLDQIGKVVIECRLQAKEAKLKYKGRRKQVSSGQDWFETPVKHSRNPSDNANRPQSTNIGSHLRRTKSPTIVYEYNRKVLQMHKSKTSPVKRLLRSRSYKKMQYKIYRNVRCMQLKSDRYFGNQRKMDSSGSVTASDFLYKLSKVSNMPVSRISSEARNIEPVRQQTLSRLERLQNTLQMTKNDLTLLNNQNYATQTQRISAKVDHLMNLMSYALEMERFQAMRCVQSFSSQPNSFIPLVCP